MSSTGRNLDLRGGRPSCRRSDLASLGDVDAHGLADAEVEVVLVVVEFRGRR